MPALVLCLPGCLAQAPLAEVEPDASERRGAVEVAVECDAFELLQASMLRARAALAVLPAYEADIVKEERIGEDLYAPQRMHCKLRHEPYSVYLRFREPPELVGQQALFAGERYDGQLVARAAGAAGVFGARVLDPQSSLAMRANRYPITDTGMQRLLEKLTVLIGDGGAISELSVLQAAQVDGRPCTGFEAKPAEEEPFDRFRVYFDDAWGLPVAFEALTLDASGALCLLERYTYESLDLDVVLDDDDFDRRNPDYDLR